MPFEFPLFEKRAFESFSSSTSSQKTGFYEGFPVIQSRKKLSFNFLKRKKNCSEKSF